ncbi:MAG TPA: methyltransferase domain-containing protein [Thermoplasmata archaeon]|nr:methyltransferase domain-containing protein [Thermoplasmata archaeon]
MSRFLVELSGENPELAAAEALAVTASVGGTAVGDRSTGDPPLLEIDLPDRETAVRLAARLALSRRVLERWPEGSIAEGAARLHREGRPDRSIAVRPLGRPGAPIAAGLRALADAFRAGGGRIDLDRPDRVIFVDAAGDPVTIADRVAEVDRGAFGRRRLTTLPFRRPVSLAPRLARAAVNLAGVGPGDRVVDPFVGTGSLLLEAALLGARVTGIDRDPTMVRGAIQNFAHLGLEFEGLSVADAGDAADAYAGPPFDALVTDAPYGRSSSSGGEPPGALLSRALVRWAARVRPVGRIVVVVPGGDDPLPPPWRRSLSIPDRVHRSLTREFRLFRRAA